MDTFEEGLGVGSPQEREVIGKRCMTHTRRPNCGQQRLEFGSEVKDPPLDCVVEGLDTESVASEKEFAALGIPDGESEDAAQELQALRPVTRVHREEDLGVAVTPKTNTFALELSLERGEVVELAV